MNMYFFFQNLLSIKESILKGTLVIRLAAVRFLGLCYYASQLAFVGVRFAELRFVSFGLRIPNTNPLLLWLVYDCSKRCGSNYCCKWETKRERREAGT